MTPRDPIDNDLADLDATERPASELEVEHSELKQQLRFARGQLDDEQQLNRVLMEGIAEIEAVIKRMKERNQ